MVMGALLLGTIVAQAAPPRARSGPAEQPRANPGPAVTAATVEVTVIPVPSKCGEGARARVRLQNKTLRPWSGIVSFVANGTVNTPVTLTGLGADAVKVVDVTGGVLDCKKPLGPLGVRVWKDPVAPLLVKVLKPGRVFAVRDLSSSAPPAGDPRPWLRRVVLDVTCGQEASPLALVHSYGSTAQSARVTLSFGAASKTTSVQVAPNQATPVRLEVPGALDCTAPGGIPALEYSLLDGMATTGALEPSEVTFQ